MVNLMIHHRVRDFSQWKKAYDNHRFQRKKSGCKSEHLMRSEEDPNDIYILFGWDEAEKAKDFIHSDDLKERMQEAGVEGQPEWQLLDDLENKSLH